MADVITVSAGGTKGSGNAILAKVDGKAVRAGEIKKFPIKAGQTITVERPGVANTIRVTNTTSHTVRMNGEPVPAGKSKVVEPRGKIDVSL